MGKGEVGKGEMGRHQILLTGGSNGSTILLKKTPTVNDLLKYHFEKPLKNTTGHYCEIYEGEGYINPLNDPTSFYDLLS
jgi:hypothetical protein